MILRQICLTLGPNWWSRKQLLQPVHIARVPFILIAENAPELNVTGIRGAISAVACTVKFAARRRMLKADASLKNIQRSKGRSNLSAALIDARLLTVKEPAQRIQNCVY